MKILINKFLSESVETMSRMTIMLVVLQYFLMTFISCRSDNNEIGDIAIHQKNLNENEKIVEVTISNNSKLEIMVDSSGKIKSLANETPYFKQFLFFYMGSGVINSKFNVNESNNAIGDAYYFYDKTGSIESQFNYVNGIKCGNATSYFLNGGIKEFMLYDSSGSLYYRKSFDEDGKILKVEGKKG